MAETDVTNLSDEDPTKMCDHCSFRGINTQAGTYCLVCAEYLCDYCEVVHRNSKASRDHKLKPFEELDRLSLKQKALISSIMVCDIHRTETLILFCIDHSIAICNVCNTTKHRKCNTQTLKLTLNDAYNKSDVFQCIKNTKVLLSDSKDIEHSREEDKTLIENCSRKCIQEVMNIKQHIIACAERLAQDMEGKILNTKHKLIAEIESDKKAVVDIGKQMERILSSFATLGQPIGVAAFVLMMKENGNIKDGIEMKEEILKQDNLVTLELQQSDTFVTLLSEITSMGILEVKVKQISKPKDVERRTHHVSFQCLSSMTVWEGIDAGTNSVSGCVFMSDGKLVICECINNSVKVLTPDLILENELTIGSRVWDVAVVSKTEVIVSKPDSNSLQFLTVYNGIEKGRSLSVGMKCWAIDCKNDKLYVNCHENNNKWGHKNNIKRGVVKVLTMDGVTVNTFNMSQGYPDLLAVNSSGNRILISIPSHGIVCMDTTGKTLFTYSDKYLKSWTGLLFDSYDNFLVFGLDTNNVHVVKSDGTQHRIIRHDEDDGHFFLTCLAWRPSQNRLVVGLRWNQFSLMKLVLR